MESESATGSAYPRTGKRGVPQQFPRRLYNMLEAESQLQQTDETLIAWSETGKAFRIEDVTLFSTLVLPKYFRTNKFSSFQRNLNLYGFSKVRRGPDADMYAHPSFLRGQTDTLAELTKCKSAADRKRQTKTPKQPNAPLSAYAMPEILPAPSALLMNSTRAVSPSSSLEDDTNNSNFNNSLRNIAHLYGQQAQQQQQAQHHFNMNSSFNPSVVQQILAQSYQQQQQHPVLNHVNHPLTQQQQQHAKPVMEQVTHSNTHTQPAQPSGKLDLLTLAITCLADANVSTAI
jgi:hypothetical protein